MINEKAFYKALYANKWQIDPIADDLREFLSLYEHYRNKHSYNYKNQIPYHIGKTLDEPTQNQVKG